MCNLTDGQDVTNIWNGYLFVRYMKWHWRTCVQSSSDILKLAGDEEGKDEGRGRCRVWGWYLFNGMRCQWKIPVANTPAARTLGAGTVTLLQVINAFAQIVYAESYTIARPIPTPSSQHFFNTFQVSRYQNLTVVNCGLHRSSGVSAPNILAHEIMVGSVVP
jgi:hypothetical protein